MDNEDVRVSLLDDDAQDKEALFISEIYLEISSRYRRADGIYAADLYFDMFQTNGHFWWMDSEHPYAIMIDENHEKGKGQYPCSGTVSDRTLGYVVVYENWVVQECVESIKQMCNRHALKIIEK